MSGILMAPFFASGEEPVGQQVWTNSTTSAATYDFVVPDGVSAIWIVMVNPGGTTLANRANTNIKRGETTLLACNAALGGNVGGGNGGTGSPYYGAGAGGYSGNGGNGPDNIAGSGGGGAGGNSFYQSGGGVGLLGAGPSGTTNGQHGSVQFGNQAYGGSAWSITTAVYGGNLRWTQLAVSPGETLTIAIAARQSTSVHTHGACRIMWGGGRSYPNNAGDL